MLELILIKLKLNELNESFELHYKVYCAVLNQDNVNYTRLNEIKYRLLKIEQERRKAKFYIEILEEELTC